MNEQVRLTRDQISAASMVEFLRCDEAGAVTTFEGTVRSEQRRDGCALSALDYSAYEAMAVQQMAALRDEALQRFEVVDAAVAHRLGSLSLGEVSVAIAVTAGHRAAAFDACRWLIDAIKRDVPIWKKEIWQDGKETWSEPPA